MHHAKASKYPLQYDKESDLGIWVYNTGCGYKNITVGEIRDKSDEGSKTADYWAKGETEVTTKIRLGATD